MESDEDFIKNYNVTSPKDKEVPRDYKKVAESCLEENDKAGSYGPETKCKRRI